MLLLWLLDVARKLARRRKGCRFITVAGKSGEVRLSENAVVATVKLAAEELPRLTVEKVRIYRTRKGYEIEANAAYELSDVGSVAEIAGEFRKLVTARLANSLGVTNIAAVNLLLASVKRSATPRPEAPKVVALKE